MRPLSDEATRLLKALFSSAWHHSTEDQARSCLVQLAALRERRAVVPLLSLIAHQGSLIEVAAETIDVLLAGIGPSELAWLDQHARTFGYESAFDHRIQAWERLTPPDVTNIARRIPAHTRTLSMLTCHHNGRVRETAVIELASSRDGAEIPVLTIRVNDWAMQVAQAASILLDARLVSGNRSRVLDALPFIVRLQDGSRRDHDAFIDAARAVIVSDEGAEALPRIGNMSPRVRRFVLQTVWESEPQVDNQALVAAMRSSDVTCRSMAVAWLGSLPDEASASLPLLEELSQDSASSVRREAIRTLIDLAPERREALVSRMLLDQAASVRSFARFLVRRHAIPSVPRDFYLTRVRGFGSTVVRDFEPTAGQTGVRPLSSAVAGLGETGTQADAETLEPLMAADEPRVRKAALQAIARLDPARSVTLAVQALHSDRALHSTAIRVLGTHAHLADFGAIAAARRRSNEPALTRRIIRLFSRAPKWEVPALFLELLDEGDAAHREEVLARLNMWLEKFPQRQVPPAPDQLARLRSRLEAPADLPESVRRELEFVIGIHASDAEA